MPATTTFTWTLEGLSLATFTDAAPGDYWCSPEFNACGVRWALQMYPAQVVAGESWLSLYLLLREPKCTLALAHASLVAGGVHRTINTDQIVFSTVPLKLIAASAISTTVHTGRGFKCVIAHSALKAHIAADGTMVVTATLRARTLAAASLAAPPPPSLQTELAALLATGEGADVDVRVSGEHIPAHSFVLALRSSMLKAQLRGPFATAPIHVVNVPDTMTPDTCKQLLRFLYTDEAPPFESHEAAAQLLQAANYYGVPRLLTLSERALAATLTAENAVTTLELAHTLSRAELRASVLCFVAKDAGPVIASAEWGILRRTYPELTEALLHTVTHGVPPIVIPAAAAQPAPPAPELTSSPAKRTRKRGSKELG